MKEISTCNGFVFQVDDEDYERVSSHGWWGNKFKKSEHIVYPQATVGGHIFLHHFLMGRPPEGPKRMVCDHIDGNTLNNQRSNLRWITHAQNIQKGKSFGKTSAYRGVSFASAWKNQKGGWRTAITTAEGKRLQFRCKDELSAALKYDELAREHYGEFANLNFP